MALSFTQVAKRFLELNVRSNINLTQVRWKKVRDLPIVKKRNPAWFTRPQRVLHEDNITKENREFIDEVINDQYGIPTLVKGVQTYPKPVVGENANSLLKLKEVGQKEFDRYGQRCGVLARKIGVVPLWKKNGTKIYTTMLQVDDNHVIKYIPPEKFMPAQRKVTWKPNPKFGCVIVGAGSADPSLFTKAYCGLFAESGVIPKRHLGRFRVSADAELLPGTPLDVSHFKVGDYVDVRGKTIDRGFQGVMKRWGFSGMPASHGVTKTHRRPGNIGSGGQKARVWPGQKMPGHMGNRYRITRGLKVWRINYKYNVMWVSGLSVAGETNTLVHVYDTFLPLKRKLISPPYPTFLGELDENAVDVWDDELHNFRDPTISFEVEEK